MTLKSRVLDGGVGTAGLSLALARRAGVDFQLDGVDLSPRMLQQAGSVMEEIGLPARLHCRSIEDLRFPDSSFDLVMSAHLLEHLTDPLVGYEKWPASCVPAGLYC